MNQKIRVVHYLNQFFAQIGGEDKGDVGPAVKAGLIGAGRALQQALGEDGEVVATIFCGDNFFAEHQEQAIDELLQRVAEYKADLLIAGPAFESGRYGVACGAICQAAQQRLGIVAVAGMDEDNVGAGLYRKNIYIVNSGATIARMVPTLQRMAALGMKLARREAIGKPADEGYLSRGIKRNEFAAKPPAERAVDMLLAKLRGEEFHSEIAPPKFAGEQTGRAARRIEVGGDRAGHRRRPGGRRQSRQDRARPADALHDDSDHRRQFSRRRQIRCRSFRLRHRHRQSRSQPFGAPRYHARARPRRDDRQTP